MPGKFLVLLLFLINRTSAWWDGCDFTINVVANSYETFQSPDYPNYYTSYPSICRWTVKAPVGYIVAFNCFMEIPCDTDTLLLSRLGDSSLSKSEQMCGDKDFEADTFDNAGTMGLVISSSTTGGRFQCNVAAIEKDCQCGVRNKPKPITLIVNGEETFTNEFPMLVAIVDRVTPEVFCGGTLSKFCIEKSMKKIIVQN